MTEREHELLRELIDLRVKNKFLRERVGYLRGDIEAHLMQLTADRDAARAEVERLKIILDSIRAARSLLGQLRDHVSDQACEELECILSDEPLNADGELYITPSQQAFRRGAEAMREAAADLFQGNKPGLAAIPTWSAFIRALPIPEDKS